MRNGLKVFIVLKCKVCPVRLRGISGLITSTLCDQRLEEGTWLDSRVISWFLHFHLNTVKAFIMVS